MAEISYWKKFRLLVWKNFLMQWNNKLQFAFELLLPVIFTMFAVLLRCLVSPKEENERIYAPANIYSLNGLSQYIAMSWEFFDKYLPNVGFSYAEAPLPIYTILYSPNNKYLNKIMQMTADLLAVNTTSYLNASMLSKELEAGDYLAGIEFDDSLATIDKFPEKLSFALRFPGELRASKIDKGVTWSTYNLYPEINNKFPEDLEKTDNCITLGYLREGFIAIQNAISKSFISLASGQPITPLVEIRQYPYPAHIVDPLLIPLKLIIPLIIVVSFIYPCSRLVKSIAYEKENQLKQVLRVMGLSNSLQWLAWFFRGFIILLLGGFTIALLLKIKYMGYISVLEHSTVIIVLIFITVYTIATVTFCFMISVFFSKANTAAAAVGLVLFTTYLPYVFIWTSYTRFSWHILMAWCLLSNTAMALGVDVIINYEDTGEGIQWNNLFSPLDDDQELTLGNILCMMMMSSVIYMCICLYVEHVFPSNYGTPQKWYYLFTKIFWCGQKDAYNLPINTNYFPSNTSFETQSANKFSEVRIINLTKRFGRKLVVKNVYLQAYQNQILVLLGHNEAGKTAIISILTGLIPPTSGTAIISGYDIRKNPGSARTSLGFCPKQNVIFENLTLKNHLQFFCYLRGLKKKDTIAEVQKYLSLLHLQEKANTLAIQLSTDTQRRLSVCCALCGGTKVVICDDPSHDMDLFTKRDLWNILLSEKTNRTIFVTTQYMDDADILGDRVAIIKEGRIMCYGTPLFLKRKFGSGYKLTCIKSDDCNIEAVTELLQEYIPNVEVHRDITTEVSYELPYSYANIFGEMFRVLETKLDELGLTGFRISMTSMEEVFLKFSNVSSGNPRSHRRFRESLKTNYLDAYVKPIYKATYICNQFRAMFLKKALYTWRRRKFFITENILAIFIILSAFYISKTLYYESMPPLKIELKMFKAAVTVLDIRPSAQGDTMLNKTAREYENIAKSYGSRHIFKSTNGEPFEDFILRLGKTHQAEIDRRYIAAATIDKHNITAWVNSQPLHTAPLTLNLVYNAIARAYIGPDAAIEVTNKPLRRSPISRINSIKSVPDFRNQLTLHICFWICFPSSMYIIFPVKERVTKLKFLQFASGVPAWIFWITHLIWDLFTLLISASILIIMLVFLQDYYYKKIDDFLSIFLLITAFGLAALPSTYIFSFFFKEPLTAFARILTINIFFGMVLYVCIATLNTELESNYKYILHSLMLHPHFALPFGIHDLSVNLIITDLCGSSQVQLIPTQIFCSTVPRCCNITSSLSFKCPGSYYPIIYMLTIGGTCILLLLIHDCGYTKNWIKRIKKRLRKLPDLPRDTNTDGNSYEEQIEIANMSKLDRAEHQLVFDRVTKYYGNFVALYQVSFRIKGNECFGLLGINGAGKTTAFKILTGGKQLSYGSVYVQGYNITTEMNKIHKVIGYSPQMNALRGYLTGYEYLRIFALLRGVPRKKIKFLSTELADSFGFKMIMNNLVSVYSDVDKRKLSAALAVIGNPSIICLDEPTTGMDPIARKRFWTAISMFRDSGKAIFFSSQCAEECEIMCTHLAVLVNGQLEALGSVQHLKNNFSKDFVLKIKIQSTDQLLKHKIRFGLDDATSRGSVMFRVMDDFMTGRRSKSENPPNEEVHTSDNSESSFGKTINFSSSDYNTTLIQLAYANRIKKYVERTFPTAVLKDYYQRIITYHIPLTDVKWSQLFGFMEENRIKLHIEDYEITQAALDDIFIDFASNQIDVRDYGLHKSCCSSKPHKKKLSVRSSLFNK